MSETRELEEFLLATLEEADNPWKSIIEDLELWYDRVYYLGEFIQDIENRFYNTMRLLREDYDFNHY